MKTYEKNIEDRKVLVKRLEELTGSKGKYTFVPRCAYLFEGCAVEKDGTLTCGEEMDTSIIHTLIADGLIKAWVEETEMETAGEEAETETVDDAEETADAAQEEAGDTEEAVLGETGDEDSLTVSLPLAGHTGESIRRMLNMVYSRGKLLSRSTGGSFRVEKELLTALDEAGELHTAEQVIEAVREYAAEHGGLEGLRFEEDRVSFTGFPYTEDAEKVQAFQQLAVQMNRHVLAQKRIQAKEITEENEKYIFRIWLVRIGMDGAEFKTARKILLENLSGHTAFHTKADEQKWKARQKEKREAVKAAKADGTVPDPVV